MNWETGEGHIFEYFVFGAACSEVEIDCLTGNHKVSSTRECPLTVLGEMLKIPHAVYWKEVGCVAAPCIRPKGDLSVLLEKKNETHEFP